MFKKILTNVLQTIGLEERIIMPFEVGRRGKPDELEMQIAQFIGAYFLEQHPGARFDLRVCGSYSNGQPNVRVSGEASQKLLLQGSQLPINSSALDTLILEHYNRVHRSTLTPNDLKIEYALKAQSDKLATNGHAGDSGNPIAVAYRAGPHFLPWERYLGVGIRDLLDTIYQNDGEVPEWLAQPSGISQLPGLRADGKIGVNAIYKGAKFCGIDKITIAAEHEPTLTIERLQKDVDTLVRTYLGRLSKQYNVSFGSPRIITNGNGAWNIGGWQVDEGSREAKSYRDGFGPYGIVEDSFSGEDPSKPSGTGTFLARYIAVQLVAHNLAHYARVTLDYTIGSEDVGLNIVTLGTGKRSQEALETWVRERIPLRIRDATQHFDSRRPSLYRQTAQDSDFFQNPELPWNQVRNYQK